MSGTFRRSDLRRTDFDAADKAARFSDRKSRQNQRRVFAETFGDDLSEELAAKPLNRGNGRDRLRRMGWA